MRMKMMGTLDFFQVAHKVANELSLESKPRKLPSLLRRSFVYLRIFIPNRFINPSIPEKIILYISSHLSNYEWCYKFIYLPYFKYFLKY